MRTINLQGIDNVRDLGGIPVCHNRMITSGLFYRGSALVGITEADRGKLFDELNISCVIDLRCGWEREAHPNASVPVDYFHIPFYDKEKVGLEYTEPAMGTKTVGRDIACDPTRFYQSLANPLTVRQMRQAIERIFGKTTKGLPVYYHCSGGKDRAGILSVLILTILGASREDILDDYLLTNESRDKNYEQLFERFLRLADGNKERAHELVISHRALPENLTSFYSAIDERYGSMEEFICNQLGIDDSRRQRLQETCTTYR